MKRPVKIRPGQPIVITPLEALLVHDDLERREEKRLMDRLARSMDARARQKHGPRRIKKAEEKAR
jgi:hypothetical protein